MSHYDNCSFLQWPITTNPPASSPSFHFKWHHICCIVSSASSTQISQHFCCVFISCSLFRRDRSVCQGTKLLQSLQQPPPQEPLLQQPPLHSFLSTLSEPWAAVTKSRSKITPISPWDAEYSSKNPLGTKTQLSTSMPPLMPSATPLPTSLATAFVTLTPDVTLDCQREHPRHRTCPRTELSPKNFVQQKEKRGSQETKALHVGKCVLQ